MFLDLAIIYLTLNAMDVKGGFAIEAALAGKLISAKDFKPSLFPAMIA